MIKLEIQALRTAERFDLWRDLAQEFAPSESQETGFAEADHAWEAEIEVRKKEVEQGKVELVLADDAIRQVRGKLDASRANHTTAS